MEIEVSSTYGTLDYSEFISGCIVSVIIWSAYKNHTAPALDKYHTFWSRFWAPVIDELVLWVPTTLIPYLGFKMMGSNHEVAKLLFVGMQFLYFGYSVYFHGKFGATFGKMTTKVKVVDAITEEPITFTQALIRDSVLFVLVVMFWGYAVVIDHGEVGFGSRYLEYSAYVFLLWFLAEIITMFTNEKRRALHDFMAGTVIIRTNIPEEGEGCEPIRLDRSATVESEGAVKAPG